MMVVIRSMFSLPHVIDWHCRHRCYRVGDCQPMNLMPVPLLLPVEEPLEPLLPEFELDDPPVELEEEPEPLADPEPDPVEPLPVPVVPPVVPEPVEPPVVPELVEESVPVEPSVDHWCWNRLRSRCRLSRTCLNRCRRWTSRMWSPWCWNHSNRR